MLAVLAVDETDRHLVTWCVATIDSQKNLGLREVAVNAPS